MALTTGQKVGVGAVSPAAGVVTAFGGGGKHHTQMQYGYDFNQANPDDIATLLGKQGYTPAYDSNKQGSFEGAFNNILNNLTPDQLIKRYSKAATSQLNTPLDQLQYQAYQTAKQMLGRDVTAQEFAQILPAFQGPNGLLNGRAALANLAQQYKLNPSIDPSSKQNTQNPADIGKAVTSQFQSVLGRTPTADELAHFTQAIQSNQTDAYGLGNFLKQMPEYTNAQDAQFRQGLNTELSNYDTTEFNREKGDVISAYAKQGITNSPSLDYALTDLMGRIAANRSNYLAGLSANQYGGNKQLAIGNYQNTLDQMYNNNLNQRNQQANYGQQLLTQGFAGADYNTEMNSYLNYMNANKGRSTNPLYGAIGGLLGAGIGSKAGPSGAQAGYQIGSGLGNSFGYLNS